MKREHSWICRCTALTEEGAIVTLRHRSTGEELIARCPILAEQGASIDDEFLVTITKKNSVKLRKLQPKPITPERVRQIRGEMENRWPNL